MIMISNPKFSLMPFEEALESIEGEFEGWEILAEKYHSWKYRDEIEDALSKSDIEVQVHAPLNDINIASINPEMRKASVKEVKKSIKLASTIGARTVTVHPGLYSPLSRYWDGAEELAKESLSELSSFSEEHGVRLAMENLPDMWLSICSKPEETGNFLEELNIDFCLDIGHAYTTNSLDEFLEFSPINVHLHDNNGDMDEHLVLGDGKIDIKKALHSLDGYGENFVIEGRGLEELKKSKKRLESMLKELDIE